MLAAAPHARAHAYTHTRTRTHTHTHTHRYIVHNKEIPKLYDDLDDTATEQALRVTVGMCVVHIRIRVCSPAPPHSHAQPVRRRYFCIYELVAALCAHARVGSSHARLGTADVAFVGVGADWGHGIGQTLERNSCVVVLLS